MYEKNFCCVAKIFLEYDVGIETRRDKLIIIRDNDLLFKMILNFCQFSEETMRNKYELGKDSCNWKVLKAQQDACQNLNKEFIRKILYRPFEICYIYYKSNSKSGGLIGRPCQGIMKYTLIGNNCSLLIENKNDSAIVSSHLIDCHSVAEKTYLFPMYIYQEGIGGSITKSVNFTDEFQKFIKGKYNGVFNELDIFFYIYGVLNSAFYKSKCADYLKQDFAKIPFADDIDLFRELSKLGKWLTSMHMLQEIPNILAGDFKEQTAGDNLINRLRYENMRVYINENKYFDDVTQAVWIILLAITKL